MNRIIIFLMLFFVLVSPVNGKDRSFIRVQSTESPLVQNVIIVLSPFLDQIEHEVIDTIGITLTTQDSTYKTSAEEIIKSLMQKASSIGANAIAKLEIGAGAVYGYSDFEDKAQRVHRIYGKAIAIKILPAKSNK